MKHKYVFISLILSMFIDNSFGQLRDKYSKTDNVCYAFHNESKTWNFYFDTTIKKFNIVFVYDKGDISLKIDTLKFSGYYVFLDTNRINLKLITKVRGSQRAEYSIISDSLYLKGKSRNVYPSILKMTTN
ncbi:hypothetical protein GCM10027043_40520 [Ferruginibacter profundus]